jgi:hypothetical protein
MTPYNNIVLGKGWLKMLVFAFLLISLLGVGSGFSAFYFEWQPMPLYSLIIIFPSLYVIDYYTTMQGLKRGQEEVNPIMKKFFLTGDLKRDLTVPIIALVGLAVIMGTIREFTPASYSCVGMYLGLFIHNGLL